MANSLVRITEEVISIDEVYRFVADPRFGAQLVFSGVVRNRNHGRDVRAMTYDSFGPLAQKTMESICAEAEERWNDIKTVLIHRTGRLEVGDCSVVIGVGSVHRDEAYQASRYIIEELKTRVPIWKQEHYLDGDSAWIEGCSLCDSSTRGDKAKVASSA